MSRGEARVPSRHELAIVPDPPALHRRAAEEVTRLARQAVQSSGAFRIVLSGGATPRGLYELLARAPYRDDIAWEKTEIFWGDERPVPPDHPQSNYRMAREALLDHVPVPEAAVHRIRGEVPELEAAARDYEALLRDRFPDGPRFDLVLLGLGADAHTASLFPGSAALRERRRLVVAPWVEGLGTHRVTMTPKAINAASEVLFLVAGAGKAEALAAVLEGAPRPQRLPAQAIRPELGRLLFIVDREAAGGLHHAE